MTCLGVGLLRIDQISSVCCKTVCRWVTTSFMNDIASCNMTPCKLFRFLSTSWRGLLFLDDPEHWVSSPKRRYVYRPI